jgi:probable blue pigment (indigoidine) exporter
LRARSPTISTDAASDRRLGAAFLLATALGWGLNWPILKALLAELPPLAARGWAGLAAMLGLFAAALALGQSLRVLPGEWRRLLLASALNVTAWMGLATVGLLWLDAGEGAIVAYTMPVWAALAASAFLGERLTAQRILALVMGLAGVAILLGAHGLEFGLAKLPGAAMILAGAMLFALGTVLTKRAPITLAPLPLVGWQVGLGCLPMLLASPFLERPDFGSLSTQGWLAMAYMAVFPLCLCYLTWFAALRRLPAGAAAIGTLLTPLIGVLSASAMLAEPIGLRELTALALTLAGILLAMRT